MLGAAHTQEWGFVPHILEGGDLYKLYNILNSPPKEIFSLGFEQGVLK